MRRVVLLALLAACGIDNQETGDHGPYEYSTCAAGDHVGTFRVDLAEDFTGVQGHVEDRVAPLEVPVEVAAGGDCRVLRSPELFCDPACEVGTTCDADGTCVPAPTRLSVGVVTIRGLAELVEMEPRAPDFSYTNPDPLPHPGVGDGAEPWLEAEGADEIEGFGLGGLGVSPLDGLPGEIAVVEGEDLFVHWDGGGGDRLQILLDFAQHGGPHIWIECDTPNDGTALVGADLLDELLGSEVSGFPSATFIGRSVQATTIAPGCVDFQISTATTVPVDVPGVISCTDDEPCPEPQTCQPNLTCG